MLFCACACNAKGLSQQTSGPQKREWLPAYSMVQQWSVVESRGSTCTLTGTVVTTVYRAVIPSQKNPTCPLIDAKISRVFWKN